MRGRFFTRIHSLFICTVDVSWREREKFSLAGVGLCLLTENVFFGKTKHISVKVAQFRDHESRPAAIYARGL